MKNKCVEGMLNNLKEETDCVCNSIYIEGFNDGIETALKIVQRWPIRIEIIDKLKKVKL